MLTVTYPNLANPHHIPKINEEGRRRKKKRNRMKKRRNKVKNCIVSYQ